MAAPDSPARHAYLDALRGWAILGVVATHCAFHAGNAFPGFEVASAGRYGVQLFFVVSAFTIFLTLERARARGAVDWTGFFLRRFFRVLPMFWVGLALYAFVPGRVEEGGSQTPADYVLTALLLHGGSPGLINRLVPGGWSIAAEAAFYLVVPLVCRFVRGWQGTVWLLAGALALSGVGINLLQAAHEHGVLGADCSSAAAMQFAYCWFPTQFPAFVCGLLVYFLARARAREAPAADPSTGAALFAVAALALHTAFRFGKHGWLLEPVCYALAYIPLVLGLQAWPVALLVNPALCFLGRISYSVYLLHFAVLGLALNSLDTVLPGPWQHGLAAFGLLGVATLAGTVGPAWLAYRWVEQPGIDLGRRLARLLAAGTPGAPMIALPRTMKVPR